VEYTAPDHESQSEQQRQLVAAALDRKPAALVLAATDSQALRDQLDRTPAMHVPVIAVDSGVDGDVPLTTVGTDNAAAAEEAARRFVDLVRERRPRRAGRAGDPARVAVLCHSRSAQTGVQRRDAIRAYIEREASDVRIVDIQYTDSDGRVARETARALLAGNPDLAGIIATDDDGSVAAANEVEAAGRRGRVVVVGFDSGREQLAAVRSGAIAGAVTQNPYLMGHTAVEKAVAAMEGRHLSAVYYSGHSWYDRATMTDPEVSRALYECRTPPHPPARAPREPGGPERPGVGGGPGPIRCRP